MGAAQDCQVCREPEAAEIECPIGGQCQSGVYHGKTVRTIKDGFELSDNINSKIIAFAFALAAEIERNLISQRTKEALALKRASGIRLGRPKGHSKKKESASRRWDEISAMIDKGIPMSQIARCVGVHRNTLRKYIERFSKDE